MMNTANAPPGKGRRFYFIRDNGDGTADVILFPRVVPMTTPEGATDYDICGVKIVEGVPLTPDLEDDVRARYYAWCESAETIFNEKEDSTHEYRDQTGERGHAEREADGFGV